MDQLEAQWIANLHLLLDDLLTHAEDDPNRLRGAQGAVARRRGIKQLISVTHRAESRIEGDAMPRRAGGLQDRFNALLEQ